MHQSPKGAYRQLPLCLVGDFTLCEVDPPYTVPQLMLVGIAPPARHAKRRGVFISQPQKVSLFVDVQNIYYTCRQAYQANFDYNKFWAEITEGRELVSAIAYATDRGDAKQMEFQAILRAIGFEVKLKPMLMRKDGTTKGDWDVGIALDVYEAAPLCDTVILASGDGDFGMLLARIRQRFGTGSEVYGVPALTSDLLTREADRFVPIDQRLLLK